MDNRAFLKLTVFITIIVSVYHPQLSTLDEGT
jgi:hypothetical protein